MDDSMREMGVGDLAVPRKMRRIGEAFYGRQTAYRAALDEADERRLAAALERAGTGSPGAGARLATYVRAAAGALAAQDGFERAQLTFPDPERVLLAREERGGER
jgi:cytochrome b pre-mRNA-processing protein 3